MSQVASAPPTLEQAGATLRTRSLWTLVPCTHDGVPCVAVATLDQNGTTAVRLDTAGTAFLRLLLRDKDRVVFMEDAKATQRLLLVHGVDVRRPICRRTLDTITGGGDVSDAPVTWNLSIESAKRQANALCDGLEPLMTRTHSSGQHKVARLECLVTRAFAALEHRGLPVDHGLWRKLINDDTAQMASAKARFFALAGDHVQRDLFGHADLNLDADAEVKALIRRATGHDVSSIAAHVLTALGHPLTDAFVAYRAPWKVVTTYGDSFLEHVRDTVTDSAGRQIGRVRSSFVPLGASTGRVACREPNLQNLPKDARFHEALRAPAGRVLVTADYATCELRIVAELAHDPVFIAAFDRGEDLHSTVASTMFGTTVSKTQNPELRQRAKAINFGLVYGMGAASLADSLGVDRKDADELLARYFQTFPRIRDYLEDSVEIGLKRGYSETVLGRRLVYDQDIVKSDNARGELGRIMKNMPIQGTSADMTKLAMVRIHERLAERIDDAGLVNTVHDELVVECDAAVGEEVAALVRDEMSEAHRTLLRRVPPEVEVHVGETWHH